MSASTQPPQESGSPSSGPPSSGPPSSGPPSSGPTAEHARLAQSPSDTDPWRLWGPYLSERQWGTVREDYSADGNAWDYFDFDQAHRRAYRWGEDGMGGFCDRYGFLNFSVAMWNGRDDRIKERLFGLTNGQGNHGEDVKEYWWPLDATPTHSWAQWLYRYPQGAYPYQDLVETNAARGRNDPEYELADTGLLEQNRFFDVQVSHAKAGPDDICISITATNHGPEAAPLDLLPQLWFRNTWAWGRDSRKPSLRAHPDAGGGGDGGPAAVIEAEHGFLGRYVLAAGEADGVEPQLLFCDNESDDVGLFGAPRNRSHYSKDGINRAVVHGDCGAVNPEGAGTKAALRYHFDAVRPGESVTVRLRLVAGSLPERPLGAGFEATCADRAAEADAFHAAVVPAGTSVEDAHIARRAFAGLLWGKQLYRYSVKEWLTGDPGQPVPPDSRRDRNRTPPARNTGWAHLALADVISMPDSWEYPWFASWDLAFHCVSLAHIDPAFAKNQLILLCREWAMHPDGQLPAYEWSFGDVNPPVHAWAAWQVYCIDGKRDTDFLIRIFTKLLLNFSWWVNRKDPDGSNLFEGGFLGMDNIGLFDRSKDVPAGHRLEQSDATSWMAFYCLAMLRIALELARADHVWEDLAIKFLHHFLSIAEAVDSFGSGSVTLWDEADGFCYDVLIGPDGSHQPLKVRSMVGLLPLMAVAIAPQWTSELPGFTAALAWLRRDRPELAEALLSGGGGPTGGEGAHQTLSLLPPERYLRVLSRLLDTGEFLSPHGIRSMSAAYREPFTMDVDGARMSVAYVPGESESGLFGGNSNWRGPVWFPVNILLADALATFSRGAGAQTMLELPTGSGTKVALTDVAHSLHQRLVDLFRPDDGGRRPGTPAHHPSGPLWDTQPTFSEYFHGDTGAGLGASHQTGWTALAAHIICSGGAVR